MNNIEVIIKCGVGYHWDEDGCNMLVERLPDDFPIPRIGEQLTINETVDVDEQIGEIKISKKTITKKYLVTGIERWYNRDTQTWGIDICVTPIATGWSEA